MTKSSERLATAPQLLATLTIFSRLRGTRFLALFIGLCALFGVLAVMQAVGVHRDLNSGALGFDIQRHLGVALVGGAERWPTLEAGDELLAFEGQPIVPSRFFETRAGLPVGPLKATFRRNAVVFEAQGEVLPMSRLMGFALAVRLLAGVLVFLFGASIFVLRPGTKQSWLFFLLMYEVGLLTLLMQSFPSEPFIVFALIGALFCTAPVVGFQFYSTFPSVWAFGRHSKRLYGAALALAFVGGIANVIDLSPRVAGWVDAAIAIWSSVACLPGLVAIVYQWRFAREQRNPRLIEVTRTLVLATVGGLILPLVANMLIRSAGLGGSFAHFLSVVSVLVYAGATAVVLVRHNPFDVDRYAASMVGYVITLGVLAGLLVAAFFALPLVFSALGFANSREALVAMTALIFLSVGTVYRRLRRAVDAWFSREQVNPGEASEALRLVADSVQNDPRATSLQRVVDAALVLGAESAALWQIGSTGQQFERLLSAHGPTRVPPLERNGALEQALAKAGGIAGLCPRHLPLETQQALLNVGLVMSAPVRAHGVPVGFLGVGRLHSGFGYREQNLAFLETLASQAGLALERGEVVTRIGRYRVEKKIAAGGSAEVFLAWQLGPGGFERKVALKRLLPELAENPRAAASLLDEARIAARLQHANIAQIYEVGVDAGQHFIAMEFVEGAPLRALIANQQAEVVAPLPVALSIAVGLLAALEHAHALTDSQGVAVQLVHRDVTPANVLVSHLGAVKLVDFGLAMAEARLFRTETGVARGTLPYMSPEQAEHAPIDRRADLYTAAATLYELFTGERAFPAGPLPLWRPRLASEVNPALPALLDAVFTRAFEREPAARFDRASQLLAALLEAAKPALPAPAQEVAEWVASYRTVRADLA